MFTFAEVKILEYTCSYWWSILNTTMMVVGAMLGKDFLGHQFKSGHFQCKTQIRQNNWVGALRKGPNPHSHI